MTNITVKEYFSLEDSSKYNFLEHSLPSSKFGAFDFDINKLSYKKVKGVMRTLRGFESVKDVKDIFETCYDITENEFFNSKIVDYFPAKNYIVKEFANMLEREHKLLSSLSGDALIWEAAGGKRLNRFSDILPINQLGKIYGIYPFELQDYKYIDILTLLTIEKEQTEIEKRFNEIKNK